jgi:hypothetical protein
MGAVTCGGEEKEAGARSARCGKEEFWEPSEDKDETPEGGGGRGSPLIEGSDWSPPSWTALASMFPEDLLAARMANCNCSGVGFRIGLPESLGSRIWLSKRVSSATQGKAEQQQHRNGRRNLTGTCIIIGYRSISSICINTAQHISSQEAH